MVKKKTSIKILDFDEYLGSRLSNPRKSNEEDDLDTILRDTAKMKVRRVKMMELDKYLLQSEQELEKLKRGELLTSTGGSLPSNADFLNMSKALAELSPEEAQRVRSSYTFFKLAEKGGGGSAGMNLLLPLIGYAKTNPGASENQMINYLKLMDSQLLKGMELAKAMNPPKQQGDPMNYMVKGMELMKNVNPSKENPMDFLKIVKELVIEGVRNPLMQAIKENQPTPSVLDQILTTPELRSTLKDIGLFGGSNTATSQLDLEIEKLRGERQLQVTKWNHELRRDELKRQADDRRTDNVIALFAPMVTAFGAPVAQRMRGMGQQLPPAHNPAGMPPSGMPMNMPPPGNTILIRCACGYEGPMKFPGPPPDTIKCPACGEMLVVGGISSVNGNIEKTDTGTRV